MRKKLQRLLWVAPVAMLLLADAASAQVTGTIVGVVNDAATGKPVAGALVIATSKALQGEQTAVTDGRGQYTLTALPPGVYKLSAQLQGYKPAERTDINLRVDFTLRANIAMVPEAVQMEEQVVKTGVAPAVNIGSAEAGTIVSKEYLANVPTSRTYESVATIAPTAQRDAYGISFAGASSPENNYIIDGLRVSDPSYGTLGTNLLTNFVDQLDVKVGSFMPEYGYSSAGIINTVTKSGSNEFHGSIWGNLSPGFFTPSTAAIFNNGQAIAYQPTPYKGSYSADFGFELGGPIVKDKLWFYAGFAPQYGYTARTKYYQSRTPCAAGTPNCNAAGWQLDPYGKYVMTPLAGTEGSLNGGFNTYFGIAKLTWLINESHNIFVSFNTQPTNNYGYGTGFNGNNSALVQNLDSNSTNATLNYTGKFFDKHLLLEVKGGWFNTTSKENAQTVNGVNNLLSPLVQWRSTQALTNFIDLPAGVTCPTGGCVVTTYATGGTGFTDNPTNNRYSGTASLTGLFELGGQHQLKGGIQIDYSKYSNPDRRYSGNAWMRVIGNAANPSTANSTGSNSVQLYRAFGALDPNQTLNPGFSANWCISVDANGNCVGAGQQDPNVWGLGGSNTNTMTNGYFIQDSWTIANVLTLNFGVRLDTQNMQNPTYNAIDATSPTLNITDEWSPRVQAIWDFTGTGRGKIQANWGMYYEAIPLDLALRALGADSFVQGYYQFNTCANRNIKTNPGWNPLAECNEVYGANVGQGPGPNTTNLSTNGSGFTTVGGQYTALAPDLKGAYTQQFGGGIQYEVLQDLTVGIDYLGRRLGRAIEDMSSDGGHNYYIANPAVTQPWTVPANAGGPYAGVTFNPLYAASNTPSGNVGTVKWETPSRSYDGFSLTLNKLFSKKWLAQASYTWASLRGNYGGLFRAESGQLDPNITSDYDLANLLGNKYGPLSGNKQNQFKFAGSYNATLSPEVTFVPSTQFQAFSGNPVSAYTAHPDYGPSEGYMLPRGMAGNLPWTFQWDLGAKVLWAIAGPYTLQFSLDIFNILNMQTVQQVDQDWTLDSAPSIQNAQCSNYKSATAKNPITALSSACPDLPYARTVDGSRVNVNLNYGQPANRAAVAAYQAPISARFGVALSF